MNTSARAAARAGLVGGAALLAAALTVTSATAASAELDYSCEYFVGQTEETGDATASFDTGIGEGLVVEVGDEVSIDPFTGEVTLPTGFVEGLRDAEYTDIAGGGLMLTLVDETGEEYVVELSFDATDVPAQGPMVLEVSGEGDPVVATEAGTNTLVADAFFLFVDTGEEGDEVGLFCELTDEGDVTIDAFEATAPATPTTTVTTTASATPVRPVVVQTDFAEDRSSALPLLAGAGLASATVAVVAFGRSSRRETARRH